MDIRRHFQNLTWCNPVWCFPSTSKETNELLRQCLTLPYPEINTDIEEIIKKSKEFPIPFPIDTARLEKLRETRPVEDLKTNIASTYPLIHERVLLLTAHFLIYKREFGSSIEKALYKDMTIAQFIDRILKKRAITFITSRDKYKIITGEEGMDGWEPIGTIHQKPPLVLENCLSYDEMKIAAMVYVSGHTEFINDGARKNAGIVNEEYIERNGVIIGLIGTRLERRFRMDYEDLVITEQQNCPENGYGEEVTPTTCLNVLMTTYVRNNQSTKHMWRQMWSEFYQVHSYTYNELTSYVNIQEKDDAQQNYTDKYVKLKMADAIYDNEVYYKRLSIPFDCALMDGNERGKILEKMVFLNMVGIGLGVWKVSQHQNDVYILTLLERIRYLLKKELLNNISDVNLAFINPSDSVEALFLKPNSDEDGISQYERSLFFECKKHPKGGIAVYLENREPSSKLPAEHDGKLLVTTYAWDGNSHPGNEYWFGSLTSSGDPAAAASTQVAELHNAHINQAVSANNLRVVGVHGVLSLQEYCKKLLSDS